MALRCVLVLAAWSLIGMNGCTTGIPGGAGGLLPGSTVPDELTGQWQAVLAYVPAYYTGIVPVDGSIGSLGVYYWFGKDGQYQYNLNTASSYFDGLCFRTTRWSESGGVSIAGSQATLSPGRAIHSVLDSCGENAYVDPAPAEGQTLIVTREQDAAGRPMLRVLLPSGEELLLERCRDCE